MQFHQAGLRTRVLPSFAPDGRELAAGAEVGVLSVNAATRHLEANEAASRTREAVYALLGAGCGSFYKKLDSTLRGNVGVETAAMRRAVGAQLAVVVPAFPEAGRLTVGGYQLVDGVPVELSSYARDPLAPVTASYLPALLAASGERTGLIGLSSVLRGWEAIAFDLLRLQAEGVRLVAVDATRREDLDAIAQAIHRLPFMILPAGSAGLAAALCRVSGKAPLLGAQPSPQGPALVGRTPPVLVVCGSANPTSLAQIQALGPQTRRVPVDVRQLVLKGDEELEGLARQVLQGLFAGLDVVLATVESDEQLGRDQGFGVDVGMTPFQLGHHLSGLLGRLVSRVVAQGAVTNLVLVGGETAAHVCAALEGEQLEIVGEVLPAVPCSQLVGSGLRVVTKSGGFGASDALEAIVTHLHRTAPVRRDALYC